MKAPGTEPTVRILVVDDDPLVRSALALVLGGQPDLDVVAEAAHGREALDRADGVDVVLMDVRMPVLGGLDATRELCRREHPPRVIVLTTFDADEYVIEAVAAGADGFLLKDTPPAEIVAAVRAVAAGEPMLSPSATRALLEQAREGPGAGRGRDARARLGALTQREREVADAVARGLSNAEVAAEMHLSQATVKAHVSRLFDKLGATNRVQVAICVHDAATS